MMSEKKKTRPYLVEFCGQQRCIEAKSREAAREHLIEPILPALADFSIPDPSEVGRFMANGGKYEIAGKTIDSLDRVIMAVSPIDAALLASLPEGLKEAFVFSSQNAAPQKFEDGDVVRMSVLQGKIQEADADSAVFKAWFKEMIVDPMLEAYDELPANHVFAEVGDGFARDLGFPEAVEQVASNEHSGEDVKEQLDPESAREDRDHSPEPGNMVDGETGSNELPG